MNFGLFNKNIIIMDKFKYKKTNFNIINSFNCNDHEGFNHYDIKVTDKTIIKTLFPIYPIWIGKKFRWFKKCKVRFRLYFVRKQKFDDGLSYYHYWSKWKHEFRMIEIIN